MWCLSPFSPPLLPNLGWKLCCTRSALSLVSGYLRCECVWNSVRSKWGGGKVRKKSTNLDVDGEFLFFYAKERRRVDTDDNTCMIKWKLKPCLNDSFTQKERSHADNFYYSAINVGIYFPVKLASDPVGLLRIPVKNGAGIASMYREWRCLWRNWFDLASPWQPKISVKFTSPCLQSLCRCSKKNQLDTTSDACSPVITPVCSFWRLIHTLLGFCGSYVIKKCHGPQLDTKS